MPPADNTPSNPAASPSGPAKSVVPKLLVAIAFVFIVLLVTYGISKARTKVAPTAPAVPSIIAVQTAAINITASGFNPSTVEVKPGTSVTWTNQDSAIHQVADDPNPKDNFIPNFDSTVSLNKYDTISFTFPKVGTYTYHDERNPQLKGTVIVK